MHTDPRRELNSGPGGNQSTRRKPTKQEHANTMHTAPQAGFVPGLWRCELPEKLLFVEFVELVMDGSSENVLERNDFPPLWQPGEVLPRRQMCKMSERSVLYFILCLQLLCLGGFPGLICASETNDEVQIEVLFVPENCTQKTRKGDLLHAHYDGYLAKTGAQFYCSRSAKDGQPHWFVHGVGEIIKGLDLGLKDMCPGEKRKITVPPSLAFGEKGKDPVPPNATVIFEVELLHVRRGPRSMEAFKEMDLNNDRTLTKEEVKEHLKMEAKKLNIQKEETYFEDVVTDIFRRNDQDVDGTLTMKEYNVYEHDEL